MPAARARKVRRPADAVAVESGGLVNEFLRHAPVVASSARRMRRSLLRVQIPDEVQSPKMAGDQLRPELCGVRSNLHDEVGVQGGGDAVQEWDGGDDAAGFKAG